MHLVGDCALSPQAERSLVSKWQHHPLLLCVSLGTVWGQPSLRWKIPFPLYVGAGWMLECVCVFVCVPAAIKWVTSSWILHPWVEVYVRGSWSIPILSSWSPLCSLYISHLFCQHLFVLLPLCSHCPTLSLCLLSIYWLISQSIWLSC